LMSKKTREWYVEILTRASTTMLIEVRFLPNVP
jgi:hypothetical protein